MMNLVTESAPVINPCNLPDVSQLHFKTELFDAMPLNKVEDYVLPAPVLINGLLHRGHKMIVYGPAKAGKSYLTADLAIAIACGGEWLEHKCECGNVFICDIENGAAETYKRIEQICQNRSISKDCMNHITVTNMNGYTETTSFVNAMIENVQSDLYSAIIIDSVYNFLNGRESQSEDVDHFMKEMDRLAAALRSSIILCHHVKKATEGYTSSIDMISGSSIFGRYAQTLVGITRVYEKNDCKKEHIKIVSRHFPPHPPLNVIFKDGIFSIDSSKYQNLNTKDDLFRKSKNAKKQKAEKLISAYKNIKSDDGTAKISDLANVLDISVNTVKKHISSTLGFKKVKDGYVTYSPFN
ncbi:MAG: AAA family ATPase [Clostridia bacterium]|nr:AAA family ATPase [Clostridia bacterium]